MRKSDSTALSGVFSSLRDVLARHAGSLTVSDDTSTKYCLEAAIGPATVKSWGGRIRRPAIPVAWVELGKSYVSYHLMGISIPAVQAGMSNELKARMQGKTCFNFTANEPALFVELDALTAASIAAFKRAGFTA